MRDSQGLILPPYKTVVDSSWMDGEEEEGPAMKWPLGEILSGRVDVLHSKIFNS